jgi:hypothetical protein
MKSPNFHGRVTRDDKGVGEIIPSADEDFNRPSE